MMIKTSLCLFYEFLKIGLFNYGGGYASLPFLYALLDKYNWFNELELVQMIAVSGLTPGPIGLNMATYAGFKTLGIGGCLIASFALVFPALIISTQVFRLYKKFSENNYIKNVLYVLRPTSCALITFVGIRMFFDLAMKKQFNFLNFDFFAIVLIFLLFIGTFFLKRNPIVYMLLGAIIGVCVKNFF